MSSSHLKSLHLEHTPSTVSLHIALYRNVQNAAFLHQQLLAGNREFEYGFVDAGVIISRVHALAAAYRAINDLLAGKLKSRNVHSEIVFSLSGSNNIADSFRRFGITPQSTSLLVLKVSTAELPFNHDDVQAHLTKVIEGEQIPFKDEVLREMVDVARVRKVYKLGGVGGGGGKAGGKEGKGGGEGKGMDEEDWREFEVLVLGAMALKGLTN